jgi:flagellar biosynthesis protein FlhA
VKLADGGQNSVLLRRIAAIRRQIAAELGYVLPPVRVTDNLSLRASEYLILLKGVEIGRFELPPGSELAIPDGARSSPIDGVPTSEPAFGIAAFWIPQTRAEAARAAGYTVVDPVSVLGTHLSELVRRHAHEMFSRQDAKRLLDRVAEDNPKVVEDLVPKLLPLSMVQKVLQNLLRERVSIRDAVSILEALGEAAGMTRNSVLLTEYVRQAIRRAVVKPYLGSSADLPAYFIDSFIERQMEGAIEHGESASHLSLPPQRIREIMDRLARSTAALESPAVALASSGSRYFLRQVVEGSLPNLMILGHNEVPPGVKVTSLGSLGG